ncbi:peroxidase superfamily protein [Actinidia rufa]|uniref:peroxidase n=1 Tax=Actinidia rufa TaxID=165716 RepID=A0A7J0GE84_9ERIC|nr:peroxidase superfamily protein [Actinidia rufa]
MVIKIAIRIVGSKAFSNGLQDLRAGLENVDVKTSQRIHKIRDEEVIEDRDDSNKNSIAAESVGNEASGTNAQSLKQSDENGSGMICLFDSSIGPQIMDIDDSSMVHNENKSKSSGNIIEVLEVTVIELCWGDKVQEEEEVLVTAGSRALGPQPGMLLVTQFQAVSMNLEILLSFTTEYINYLSPQRSTGAVFWSSLWIAAVMELGSRTIGNARCTSFRQRLYNQSGNEQADFTLEQSYAARLRTQCPRSGSDQNLFFLDFVTPTKFDNSYFKNLIAYKGLLSSDQILVTKNQQSPELVKTYAVNNKLFFGQFAKSMIKMGNISPLTGLRGEIWKNCRQINY